MNRRSLLLMLPAAALAACATKPKGPTKEEVAPGLRAEAEIMKREGEKMDPALQVTNTWNIGAIDIQEQPANKAEPFRGTVDFEIASVTKEWDGTAVSDKKQKQFRYAYVAATKKWVMRP
jgi:hypothetical protein